MLFGGRSILPLRRWIQVKCRRPKRSGSGVLLCMQCHLRDWTAGILPDALDVEMVYDASIESVARYAGEEHSRSERCTYPAEVDMTVLRFKRCSDRMNIRATHTIIFVTVGLGGQSGIPASLHFSVSSSVLSIFLPSEFIPLQYLQIYESSVTQRLPCQTFSNVFTCSTELAGSVAVQHSQNDGTPIIGRVSSRPRQPELRWGAPPARVTHSRVSVTERVQLCSEANCIKGGAGLRWRGSFLSKATFTLRQRHNASFAVCCVGRCIHRVEHACLCC